MKICSTCHIEKSIPEFGKHARSRDGLRCQCKSCARIASKEYRDKNKPREKARASRWYKANAEKIKAKMAVRYVENKDRIDAKNAAYAKANRDILKAKACDKYKFGGRKEKVRSWAVENKDKTLAAKKKYKLANPGVVKLDKIKRRAIEKRAAPKWANKDAINSFYKSADALGMLTGDWYHVDHIVPLRSKLVCGLHVEHNLQILDANVNASKGNRYWPDMP